MGNDIYNLNLSQRRARSVCTFLAQNKIAASRIRFRGEGEGKPIAGNETDEGRARNRRVEFLIVKK